MGPSDLAGLPFDPTPGARRVRRSAEASFAETVVRNVLRGCPEQGELKAKLLAAGRAATGEPALRVEDLHDLGFPLTLRPVRVPRPTVGRVLRDFAKTALYAKWRRFGEADPNWGPPGRRCLVFNWVDWGVCALYDAERYADGTRLEIRLAEEVVAADDLGPLFLAPFPALVAAIAWRPS